MKIRVFKVIGIVMIMMIIISSLPIQGAVYAANDSLKSSAVVSLENDVMTKNQVVMSLRNTPTLSMLLTEGDEGDENIELETDGGSQGDYPRPTYNLWVAADDGYTFYMNGDLIGSENDFHFLYGYNVTVESENLLAAMAYDTTGHDNIAGFRALLELSEDTFVGSDSSWFYHIGEPRVFNDGVDDIYWYEDGYTDLAWTSVYVVDDANEDQYWPADEIWVSESDWIWTSNYDYPDSQIDTPVYFRNMQVTIDLPPEILTENITLVQSNNLFDVLNGVVVNDLEDGNTIIPVANFYNGSMGAVVSMLDISEPGEVTLRYTAIDSAGNETIKDRVITITKFIPKLTTIEIGNSDVDSNSTDEEPTTVGLLTYTKLVLLAQMQTAATEVAANLRNNILDPDDDKQDLIDESYTINENFFNTFVETNDDSTPLNESIGYLALESGQLMANEVVIAEADTIVIDLHDDSEEPHEFPLEWHTIELDHSFNNPVIIAQLASRTGLNNAHIRIEKIDGDTFKVLIEEWDTHIDTKHHNHELLSYIVVEEGLHELDDGKIIKAYLENGFETGFDTSEYGIIFEPNPIVLSQVQGLQDTNQVWMRQKEVGISIVDLYAQNDDAEVDQANESIGVLVIGLEGDNVAPTVEINPVGQTFDDPITVTITSDGDIIYYTLDGSEPTDGSTEYDLPLLLEDTTTVKARAYKTNGLFSEIATEEYTFDPKVFIADLQGNIFSSDITLRYGYNRTTDEGFEDLSALIVPDSLEVIGIPEWTIEDGENFVDLVGNRVSYESEGTAHVTVTVTYAVQGIILETSEVVTDTITDTITVNVEFYPTPSTPTPTPRPRPTPTPTQVRISLDRDPVELEYGSEALPELLSFDLTETITGSSSSAVTWSIGDDTIATVDDEGVVTAVRQGETTVTVRHTASGETDTADVIVFLVGDEPNPLGLVEFYDPYVYGYPDQSFRPQNSVTRAEVATMFAKILSLNVEYTGTQQFDDVQPNAWYYNYVQAIRRTNIFVGDTDGMFRPDEPITRAEMATVFGKFWEYLDSPVKRDSVDISDIDGTHWASTYIYMMYNAGIVTGFPDGTYKPNDPTLREQVVVMINTLIARPEFEAPLSKFTDIDNSHWAFGNIEAASQPFSKLQNVPIPE